MTTEAKAFPNLNGGGQTGDPAGAIGATAGEPTELHLAASLDLCAAESLRQALLEALDVHRPIHIDGGAAQLVSTACIQVLLCAAATAKRNAVPLTVIAASPALRSGFEDLGLLAELEAWSPTHG